MLDGSYEDLRDGLRRDKVADEEFVWLRSFVSASKM